MRVSPEGIRSDFHFNPKHRCASQLIWDAKNDPKNVGFSHDADCTFTKQNGKRVVTSIDKVYSVDLVSRAGTTGGLFEEEAQIIENDPALKLLAENGLAAMDNLRSMIFTANDPIESKRQRMIEAVDAWREELSNDPNASADAGSKSLKEESVMSIEYKDLTVDALTKERPDLVAVLTKQDDKSRLTEEVNTLKTTLTAKETELNTLKVEKDQRLKEAAIVEELKAVNFPVADTVAFSAKFKEQLAAAPDKAARTDLIRDRMELCKGRTQEQALPPSPFMEMRMNETAPQVDHSYDGVFGK
jgi:hypothetical protein